LKYFKVVHQKPTPKFEQIDDMILDETFTRQHAYCHAIISARLTENNSPIDLISTNPDDPDEALGEHTASVSNF
jgi:hypothetical protein